MNNIKFHFSENYEEVVKDLVGFFLRIHNPNRSNTYIFPGGSSPLKFYNRLSSQDIEWRNTDIILSDERLVPEEDYRSNTKQLKDNFFNNLTSSNKPNLLDIKKIKFNEDFISDFTLLGIGTDGHTASLFSGDSGIFKLSAETITYRSKKEDEDFYRISLTFEPLLKSRRLAFLVLGEEKREILNEILNGAYNPVKFSAQYLVRNFQGDINIFCDENSMTG